MSKRSNSPAGVYAAPEVIAMLAVVFKPAQLKEAAMYLANRAMSDDMDGLPMCEVRDIWQMLMSARTVQCGLPMRRHDPAEHHAASQRAYAREYARKAAVADDMFASEAREYVNTIPHGDR